MKENDAKDKMVKKYRLKDASSNGSAGKSPIKRLTFGGLLTLLFMLLYIPSLLNWLSGSSISSDIIRNGTIEESISTNGLIVRSEELVKAPPFDGRYIAEIGEGEKTAAFSCIATVLNKRSDSLLAEMESVNAKIVKAKMEQAEKADFFSEDLVKLDEEIGLKVQDLITACNGRSFADMGKSRHEIEGIVEKKAGIIGENSTDAYITSLKQQKESIREKLNLNTVQILSNSSGIVSYVIDGLEQVLNPANRKKLTPDQFDKIQNQYRKHQESDGLAHSGKPLAKIIKGTDIYLVAVLKEESLKSLKAGGRVKLRINGRNLETSATVDNIGEPVGGRHVVTFLTNRGADLLSTIREVDIDIINKTEEGLKVPLSCLRGFSADGSKAEIMLIKANVAAKRTVDIVCRDEEYAIVKTPEKELKKTVNLYDTYILYPDRVTEGEIVQK